MFSGQNNIFGSKELPIFAQFLGVMKFPAQISPLLNYKLFALLPLKGWEALPKMMKVNMRCHFHISPYLVTIS